MLSTNLISDICRRVEAFWQEKAQTEEFVERASGKEIGHKIADYVDEKTTAFVEAHFCVAFERNAQGKKMARSMGDLWLKCGDIYHPVNIKTGITPDGQPNMVSLKKLLSAILANRVDSYYLLMVKFQQTPEGAVGHPRVYFVDMLDYLDYVAFDSGPGQIMLKSRRFYADVDSVQPPKRSILDKAGRLMEMLEKGDEDLVRNRRVRRMKISEALEHYRLGGVFDVTPENQAELRLI